MKKLLFLILIFFSGINYGQVPNDLSDEEKIYGLSKFWQEVNYNFVYLENVDRIEWEELYKKSISEALNTKNDYEYYRLLQKFCAFLKDGHTNVWFPKQIQDNVLVSEFGDYELFLTNIEDKAIITKVNKSKLKELPIGTEIIRVNGMPTKQYIGQFVKPYISSSTEYVLNDLSVTYMLQGYDGTTFDLDLRFPTGQTKSIKLVHKKSGEKTIYPQDNSSIFEFKWLKNGIAYIAFNSFSSWDLMDLFSYKLPEIRKAKSLVIDLRKNGGGDSNVAREIIKYLTKDTILYGSKSRSRLNNAYYKAVGRWSKEKDTANNPWTKRAYLTFHDQYYYDFPYEPYSTKNLNISGIEIPTAILIGHNTASAAEDFLVYADNQENMVKIGESTYGSSGQPMIFDLPNGGTGRVCVKEDTYPDGRKFVGFGIKPEIEVKMTLSDYIENRDSVLEKAVEYLNNK